MSNRLRCPYIPLLEPLHLHTMKPRVLFDTFLLLVSACVGGYLLFSYFGQKLVASLLLHDGKYFVLALISGVLLSIPATYKEACAFLVSGPLAIALCFLALGDLIGGHWQELPLLFRPAVLLVIAPFLALAACEWFNKNVHSPSR